jgi:DeoR/GlpR family transcriptional regulator of sugar metabolism
MKKKTFKAAVAATHPDKRVWLEELISKGQCPATLAEGAGEDASLVRSMLDAGILRTVRGLLVPQSTWMLKRIASWDDGESVYQRLLQGWEAKHRVAAFAVQAEPLPPGDPAIFIDIGSSFIPLVQRLLDNLDERRDISVLRIVTASLPVVMEVLMHRNHDRVDLHLIGGPLTYRHSSTGLIDEQAIDSHIKVTENRLTMAYVGVASFQPVAGEFYTDSTDVKVGKTWAIRKAEKVCFIIDSTKIREKQSGERVFARLIQSPEGVTVRAAPEAAGSSDPAVLIFTDGFPERWHRECSERGDLNYLRRLD